MIRKTIALCCLAAWVVLAGCSTMESTWRGSKDLYKQYVNTDPKVDLGRVEHAGWEEKMSRALTPVDLRLSQMLRFLDLKDDRPDAAWADELFARHPWISGFVVADLSGNILLRRPDVDMKPLNIQPFVDAGEAFKDRQMRAAFDDTPLGPEVYAARPFFNGNDLAGFIAVHFDMRNLVAFSPASDDLVVISPGLVQWGGSHQADAQTMLDRPWDEILADEADGVVDVGGRDFVWVSRYVGDKAMVYAIQSKRDAALSWWTLGLF